VSRRGANFTILMRDALGHIVPGSVRRGHNVMTLDGRDTLTQLIVWGAFGAPNTSLTERRARWIGVGGGIQLETDGVARLVTPLSVAAGIYLKVLDHTLNVFPTITSLAVKTVFAPGEITFGGVTAVVVSEAGLYLDAGTLDPTSADNVPAFYKTFEPLVKLSSFSMEVLWELKF
jgi:hypothetical protein